MGEFCGNKLPAGLNSDCLKTPAPVRNLIITDKTLSFASLSAFLNKSIWEGKVETDLSVWAAAELFDYDKTTDDASIETTAFNKKLVNRLGTPSMIAFFDTNVGDYNQLLATLKGGTYGVMFLLEDNTLVARDGGDGLVKPFTCRITASGADIPLKETLANSYPAIVNFTSVSEFKKRLFKVPAWDVNEAILLALPVGLDILAAGAFGAVADEIEVQINERSGDAVTGLAVADFEVTESNDLDTPAVTTVVDNGLGSYTLTLEKGAVPASLDPGDYMVIRVKALTALVVDQISNELYVQA